MQRKPKTANEIKFLDGRDSRDEIHFEWYCQELKDAGILFGFEYHPEPFHLLDGVYYSATEERPRSKKEHRYTLTQPHDYTPDYVMLWNFNCEERFKFIKSLTNVSQHNFIINYENRKNRFFNQFGRTFIDVKGGYTKNSNDNRLFEYKRSLMLLKHSINVQRVMIEDLFKHTFTPARYLINDLAPTKRKITDWKPITLTQFLEER